jgi:ribosomal-protein-alanine N-acetyltransferase
VTDIITTPHLTLRRLTMDDVPGMHALFADAEVMQYWSRLPHTHIAETEAWVAETIASVDCGEADDFVVIRDGALIGRAGLWRDNELGILFARAAWGTGAAREATQALIARARARGAATIMADIDPRNVRVAKFLEKLAFRKTGHAKNTFKLGDIWTDSDYLTLDLSGE